METRANYVRVGLFTLVVLALAIGFNYWAVFSQRGSERIPLIVRIEGSVQGLQQGSQLLFNGLPVGVVRSLRIDPNNPRVVIATTEIDPGVPIRESTEASIGFQGLTGFAFIGLRGGRVNERDIVASALEQGTVPVINARPSEVTDILATARDIADRTNAILGEFENLVGTLSPSVRTTVENVAATSENVNRFTASLASNSDDIDTFLASLGRLADTANTVAEGLPATIQRARAIIEAVNPVQVSAIVSNVEGVTGNLAAASEDVSTAVAAVRGAADSFRQVGETVSANTAGIDRFLTNLGPLSDTATSVATRLDSTLGEANEILSAVDPAAVASAVTDVSGLAATLASQGDAIRRTVASVSGASEGLASLVASVDSRRDAITGALDALAPIAETVGSAARNIDAAAGEANRLVAALDSDRINAVVGNVDRLTAGIAEKTPEIQAVIDGVGRTVANVSGASEGLASLVASVDSRRDAITGALDALAPIAETVGSAARSIDAAAGEANRLVAAIDAERVNAVVGNVDRLTAGIAEKTPEIQAVIDGVGRTIGTIDTAVAGFDGTRTALDRLLVAVDPERLNNAFGNVSAASDNVAAAADQIAAVASDIGARRADINAVITNAQLTSERLASASASIDGLVTSAGNVLQGGAGSGGLGVEISQTLASIRETARSIQTSLTPIASNIERFSGQGLREVQSLVRDVTQSVDRIDRAVTDFSSNPSRLIYGGEDVKQYDGRTRR